MSNDLLKQLEAKINEAIETIEFSRMEITDLKEKNDELENRYEDWEQRLTSLIEKFEQLEDVEAVEVGAEVDTSIQKDEKAEEVAAEEAEAEAEEVEAEEVVAVETEDEEADADMEEFEGDKIEGSTFGTSADSYTEAPGSSQHYA
jgi:cell division protein ZapB